MYLECQPGVFCTLMLPLFLHATDLTVASCAQHRLKGIPPLPSLRLACCVRILQQGAALRRSQRFTRAVAVIGAISLPIRAYEASALACLSLIISLCLMF